ncbi:HAD family hydrolase [Paenibacillus solisilvae]|uniref:HAD family hydrolase n=1 Tax=Paenibacillus solisilvae TaxID=2486751 RepID=A0ABW0W5N7_9BACL
MPKAILFDLFETLITEFSDHQRISKRSYDYMALLGISNKEFKQEWGSRQHKRMTGYYPNYHAVLSDILTVQNLPIDHAVIDGLYQERITEKNLPFRQIRADILELLAALKAMKIKIGLISNCTEEEVRYWGKSELAAVFDDVIFSYEVGFAKPDKEIYLLSCEKLGAAPEEVWFVGDGGSSELEGAADAGLRPYHAFWFNTYIQSGFRKLAQPLELLKIIAEQNGDPL